MLLAGCFIRAIETSRASSEVVVGYRAWLFTGVLGVPAQVLVFMQHHFSTEPSPQPSSFILLPRIVFGEAGIHVNTPDKVFLRTETICRWVRAPNLTSNPPLQADNTKLAQGFLWTWGLLRLFGIWCSLKWVGFTMWGFNSLCGPE